MSRPTDVPAPGRPGGVVVPPVPEVDVDLRRFVRPGDTVVWGQAAGAPLALVQALVAQRDEVGPVRAFTVLAYDDLVRPAADTSAGPFRRPAPPSPPRPGGT